MAGRPRKEIADTFYDFFGDMAWEEQAIALRVMAEIHRQARRRASKKPVEPKQGELIEQAASAPVGN